jgi:hypothetical protein
MNKLFEVELFWDGDGYYYANPGDSERLGGPFIKLHEAWKAADSEGLEVTRVDRTRGHRSYRNPKLPETIKDDSEPSLSLHTLSKA